MLTVEMVQATWNAGENTARREFAGLHAREGAIPAFEAYAGQESVQAKATTRDYLEARGVFTTAYLSEWDYIEQNGHSRPI